MPRDFRLYLQDIVAAARFIEGQVARNLTLDTLTEDETRFRAILQSLIVIGEAANHIPPAIQDRAPAVPWTEIVGVRNIIVHGYFSLNLPIIWDVVANEIPGLRQEVETLLAELEDE